MVAVYMYLFLDLSLVRKKEFRERGGGTREKKVEKEKKSTLFLKESVKNYNLIYFSYRSELEEKW